MKYFTGNIVLYEVWVEKQPLGVVVQKYKHSDKRAELFMDQLVFLINLWCFSIWKYGEVETNRIPLTGLSADQQPGRASLRPDVGTRSFCFTVHLWTAKWCWHGYHPSLPTHKSHVVMCVLARQSGLCFSDFTVCSHHGLRKELATSWRHQSSVFREP